MNVAEVFVFVFIVLHLFVLCFSEGQLKVGFYSQTCPEAESIVRSVVSEASKGNSRIPPILLRLQFHDCFVQGCDGSILITGGGSEGGSPKHAGLGGFDQINTAKELVESQCPGVVSCADIVALAARDAVALAGGPAYEVETGRRDGKVSSVSLADVIPEVNDSVSTLKSTFKSNGLSDKELVVLTGGAHTIGTTACFFMKNRLYNFSGSNGSDPAINSKVLPRIKSECPNGGDGNVRIPLDVISSNTFDDQGIRNIKSGFAMLASDARLYDDEGTKKVVDSYVVDRQDERFRRDFAMAMVKMGRIGVKTGSQGEIRRVCTSFN